MSNHDTVTSMMKDRTYRRGGKVIACYKFESDSPEWSIVLPTEEAAINLMEDMYYGEYTGG